MQDVLEKDMKKCLNNKNQYNKYRANKESTKVNKNLTYAELKQNMIKEMSKENPSIYILKRDLESCRVKRREEARKSLCASDHLKEYPDLNKPCLVK